MAVARHALTQGSKGQGHMVTKTIIVAWLLCVLLLLLMALDAYVI